MVEIFRTDVTEQVHATQLLEVLRERFPDYDLHFDLDDCDRILRAAGGMVDVTAILETLRGNGFYCEVME
jgi:hypothetical protein